MAMRCPYHPTDHDWACCPDKGIQVGKDRMYTYTHEFTPTDKVDIHSKRQLNRECKIRGLVPLVKDDLTKNGMPYKPETPKLDVNTLMKDPAVRQAVNQVTRRRDG